MAVTPKYGSKELVNCITKLGFTLHRKQTGSSHVKYDPPKAVKIHAGSRSFLIVQMNIKVYDKNACNRYIKQIKDFGFTEKEVLNFLHK